MRHRSPRNSGLTRWPSLLYLPLWHDSLKALNIGLELDVLEEIEYNWIK